MVKKKSVSQGKKKVSKNSSNRNPIILVVVVILILGFIFGEGITGNVVNQYGEEEDHNQKCHRLSADPSYNSYKEKFNQCMDTLHVSFFERMFLGVKAPSFNELLAALNVEIGEGDDDNINSDCLDEEGELINGGLACGNGGTCTEGVCLGSDDGTVTCDLTLDENNEPINPCTDPFFPVCNTGVCEPCSNNADCVAAFPDFEFLHLCANNIEREDGTYGNRCSECLVNDECTDPELNVCCNDADKCDYQLYFCVDEIPNSLGFCIDDSGCNDEDYPVCDTLTGDCVECTFENDFSCQGDSSVCDIFNKICVECTPDDDDACIGNQECVFNTCKVKGGPCSPLGLKEMRIVIQILLHAVPLLVPLAGVLNVWELTIRYIVWGILMGLIVMQIIFVKNVS